MDRQYYIHQEIKETPDTGETTTKLEYPNSNSNVTNPRIVQLGIQANPGSQITFNSYAGTSTQQNSVTLGKTGIFEIDLEDGIEFQKVQVTDNTGGQIILDIMYYVLGGNE